MSTTYSRADVAKHNKKEDGWFIVNNDVYNVTKFYDDHPGGRDVLLAKIGTDATEDFEAINHSNGALKKMKELQIGTLPEAERRKYISMKEVETKMTADAAWFVINNKVYDVTKFLDNHPGGRDIILCNAGQDATESFINNNHSEGAYKMLAGLVIGDLEPSERRRVMRRKGEAGHGQQEVAPTSSHGKRGDESLLERLKEQLTLFIGFVVFIMAGIILLR
ncbi:cytochrome b-domain protein [Angomonas deanei]|uniref:Cytochrome b5-like Heme/Steroid binding domain containing protein, putative n=1 Tax=Angomonas deanei TaxID=59799 RepID=S9V6B7_9TRYP|nr:cytochrome b-domain protein [Angomonas deanei]EPY36589.1 cytochrome b-domain protein [Angomonas deanei]EPY36969.1 cytochrome b-domain protein [Angomonas deanei]EPY39864.1 cytochrome b-domain protein [Angomonas deanei]CAD2212739.1 Cytochrome b5-like Heme/Steroid binding domain containing protein, putative [Angomonas deanei]|eukprot:EPY29873.1 cytochrome b-domain protein [Angomonas deanei]